MKIIYIFFSLLILSFTGTAQSLKNYPIGNSGCSVYMVCNPGEFKLSFSQDSSKMFSAECLDNKISYGVILIKPFYPPDNLSKAIESVKSHMDYLKEKFEIHGSTGYSAEVHRLKNKENTRGLLDNWVGSDGAIWKVKAWTDGKFIAVLYVKGKIEIDESKKDLFLDGFRFPEM